MIECAMSRILIKAAAQYRLAKATHEKANVAHQLAEAAVKAAAEALSDAEFILHEAACEASTTSPTL